MVYRNFINQYRRWHGIAYLYRNQIPLIAIISLLPAVILLIISYFQTITYAKSNLERIVHAATSETDKLLKDGEINLRRIRIDLENADSQTVIKILQRQIYNDFRFREAGIINEDQLLTLTSFGTVNPPLSVSYTKIGFDPNNPKLQILGPGVTRIMEETSIGLVLTDVNQAGGVYLLFEPTILTYFLEVFPKLDLGEEGSVIFMADDGRILNSVGAPSLDDREGWQNWFHHPIQVTQTTENGLVTVTAEVSRTWALRHWLRDLALSAPVAIMISVILIFLLIRQVHQTNTLDHELKLGLAQDEFEVHYQPIINLQTSQCVGAEALIRWCHPQRGMIYPNLFIPVAEQTGFILSMTEWLIEAVLRDQAALRESFGSLYISINIPPALLNTGSVERLVQSLKRNHDRPGMIHFEITENRLVEKHEPTEDAIARLKQCGAQFILDDFGVGYSNISYLQKFDINSLKLDRYFVQGLDQNHNTSQIVDSIIELGQKLDITIIAEGIETEAQYQYLLQKGVPYGQGWLFARAMRFEDFQNFLQIQFNS